MTKLNFSTGLSISHLWLGTVDVIENDFSAFLYCREKPFSTVFVWRIAFYTGPGNANYEGNSFKTLNDALSFLGTATNHED